jgi:pimeloyl-ACP methyl ester carboxylesterase
MPVATAATPSGTVEVPVSLQVANTNTSKAPCGSDGASYTVHGHLSGPASVLRSRHVSSVTVYLFGMDAGEWNWDFTAVPGYDYASQMAQQGHVSLTLDELGYGSSGHPPDGNLTCVGAEADVTHQIIQRLRAGSYVLGSGSGISFSRVVLAGHDVGGLVAEVEAYSFSDIDGLIEVTWADQGDTPFIVQRSATASADWCTASTTPPQPGQPTGYVHFATEQDWHTWIFHDADPAVISATDSLRNVNPCGIIRTLAETVELDNPYVNKGAIPGTDPGNSPVSPLSQIKVPVLIVFGNNDTQLWSRQGEAEQQGNFSGSADRSTAFIPDSGHFPMFERSAPQFRGVLSAWLQSHGA